MMTPLLCDIENLAILLLLSILMFASLKKRTVMPNAGGGQIADNRFKHVESYERHSVCIHSIGSLWTEKSSTDA